MSKFVFEENEKWFQELLSKSGVANELGHYEDGKLQTAVTSVDELRELVQLAFGQGMIAAIEDAS